VAETLDSVARQTYPNLHIVISDDASTDGSAELCRGIAERHGFELIVQPERRGWIGNCNFLLERARGAFVCILPHDDLLDERYVEVLAAHLSATPVCVQAFCDLQAFGSLNEVQTQSSLVGSPFERLYGHITRHFDGTPFRGLVRRDALDRAGGVPGGAVGFAPDISWIAHLALQGEIHRVPEILYFKRYYEGSTHAAWFLLWDDETKIAAWADHCAHLLGIALALELSAAEQWLITHAAVRRLIMANDQRGPYPGIRRLPIARKVELVERLLARFETRFFAAGTSVEERRKVAALMVEALAAGNASAPLQALEVPVPRKAAGMPAAPDVAPARTPANLLRFLRKKSLKPGADK
jgi:glycosyltransferase involved in cell wall biosynthesis